MATKPAFLQNKEENRVKYSDFRNTTTPVQTKAPVNAISSSSALYGANIGAALPGSPEAKVGTVPTYGEFMAAKNAQNAAGKIAAGNVQPAYQTTYAENRPASTPQAVQTTPQAAQTVKYGDFTGGGQQVSYSDVQMPTTYAENRPADDTSKTVRELIEEQRKASYADAETARERAVIDAQTTYAQNRATYGKNAEALAGMGLTGSGYSDYLEGVTYASMRGDVQAAQAGELAAKREADRVYYADMRAQTEKEAAEAEQKQQTQNAAFSTLLDAAKSGNYTAEEILAVAGKQGITNRADLDMLTQAAGTAKTGAEKENIVGNITAGTTDKQIDDMIASGTLSEGNKQDALDARADAAVLEIDTLYSAGDTANADKYANQYYQNGTITKNDYQEYYMRSVLDSIERMGESPSAEDIKKQAQAIERAKNEGKISAADAEAAKKYLYSNSAVMLDGVNVNIEYDTPVGVGQVKNTTFDITINGETIKRAQYNSIDTQLANKLSEIAGSAPSNGTLMLYDDGVYMYIDAGHGWKKLSRNWFWSGGASANKRIYEILKDDIAPTQASAKRPVHKE